MTESECGICYDIIESTSKSFGYLENCLCIFCSHCIEKWRDLDRAVKQYCPICRQISNKLVVTNFKLTSKQEQIILAKTISETLQGGEIEFFTEDGKLIKPCYEVTSRDKKLPTKLVLSKLPLEQRLKRLLDETYANISPRLLEKHKLIYSFILARAKQEEHLCAKS